jgi:hypothetical protein
LIDVSAGFKKVVSKDPEIGIGSKSETRMGVEEMGIRKRMN